MGEVLRGIGVSPGVAVGRVHVVGPHVLPVVAEPIPPERVDDEVRHFDDVRRSARAEIQTLKQQVLHVLGDHYAAILEAQLLILDDPRLVQDTIQRIRLGRVSARWALKQVVGEFLRRFAAVEDPYIRERGGELDDVHRRLQRLLSLGAEAPDRLPAGPLVVVAHVLGPSDAVAIARRGAVGLATDAGGPTSHTAILAQGLSVPAVAGLHDATRRVRAGDLVLVDGDRGELHVDPPEEVLDEARRRGRARAERERRALVGGAVSTADGHPVTLRANIEFPAEVEAALQFGARGVGLYRSEFLFLTHAPHLPTEDEHYRTYVEIADKVAPYAAVIRTLDLGGEKYFHEVLDVEARNPVLGLRGVRLCLQRPDIFRPQLRGLLRAAAGRNVRVLLPLVVSAEEVRQVRRMLAEEAAGLRARGVEAREDVPLGVMIEVPAAAAAADLLARDSDFFSIGTNDLVQYALAVDRGNESVVHLYQPRHPGLLRLLRFTIRSAEAAGIPVALCGEMGADPKSVGLLLGLGLRELSVPPRALADVRDAVSRTRMDEARQEAERALGEAPTSANLAAGEEQH